MFRVNAELQAQAIEGMERTLVLGEELQRAKVQIAELAAEVKNWYPLLRVVLTIHVAKPFLLHLISVRQAHLKCLTHWLRRELQATLPFFSPSLWRLPFCMSQSRESHPFSL